jgi:PAS domain S-box-containing protein
MDTGKKSNFKFLAGGGDMGERIRSFPWEKTPLGPIQSWPQSLKTASGLMLNSQHPIWIGWGPEATFLYNDAYVDVLSLAKHPRALGKPVAEVWAEIWDICGPLADKVFQKGEASYINDVRLFMNRGDFLEETFYSFSYSPIRDESGNVGGLFCPSTEVTSKVLHARRLRILSELAAESLAEKSAAAACASAAAIIAKARDDIPFALLYLIDPAGDAALLEQAVGIPFGDGTISPPKVELGSLKAASTPWPIAEIVRTLQPQLVPIKGVKGFPLGLADRTISGAFALPVISRGQERPLGVLIAGVNPTRRLDVDYRSFFEQVAGYVATAILNARATEEETRRMEMLAALDRAKTTFFSNVSHELRTPLTLILGPLEDGMRESTNPPAWLELAHRNSLRLLKLVNTLLDFSRIEAGRFEASFEPTDLAAFTAELASVFRSGIERAGLRLLVNCPSLAQSAYVDREMWEKIVFNLLSNALKFTAAGEIEVKLVQDVAGKMVRLSVRDTGIGIPRSEQPQVFERFHRVKTKWARSQEGTGIGLALVLELARLHGGDAQVESEEGRGTTFTISIPCGFDHLPKERLAATRTLASTRSGPSPFVEEAQRWLPDESNFTSSSGTPAAANGARTEKRNGTPSRIVLADDNSDMRGYVQRLLVGEGYDVVAVPDGEAALAAVRAKTPALVLSDVMMPRLDGFGLLREMRGNPATESVPIILLSARAGEESRVEGVEAGADDYLVKPFSSRELLARVASHLELARVRREAHEQLASAHANLQNVLNSISDGLVVFDKKWRFTYLNEQAARIIGARTQDVLGGCVWDLFPKAQGTKFYNEPHRAVATGRAVHFDDYYPEPLNKWLECHCYPSETGLSVYFHDVTERKVAERARAASEQRLRAIYDGTHQYIGLLTPDGVLVEANRASLDFANSKREDVVGLPFWATVWFQFTPGAPETIQAAVKRAAKGELVRFELSLAAPSGEIKVFDISFYPIRDDKGQVVLIVPEGQEITERKAAENALHHAHAQLADKATHLEALVQQRTARLTETIGDLEAFSYSIAHDMRAPLRSLQSFSHILLSDYGDKLDEEGRGHLHRIASSANRMDKLIRDVLNYSRVVRADVPLEKVDLGRLLQGIVETYPALGREQAEITIKPPLPMVIGSEAMLMQVFSNLLGNAAKFVPAGIKPRIEVWSEPHGDHARVFVKDNGIGIEMDQHEKIFDIFQQVQKGPDSTGIGLAIVRKAAERMGGTVGVESELGRGSTFWVDLKSCEETP